MMSFLTFLVALKEKKFGPFPRSPYVLPTILPNDL